MKEYIIEAVDELIEKYDERNPFRLCECMDIDVMKYPFFEDIKGYFISYLGVYVIVVNSHLDEFLQKFICAHELAHIILDNHLADASVRKFNISDITAKPEADANLFASDLLLDDRKILSAIEEYQDYFLVAGELGVPPEILDFKIRMLRYKGYELNSFLDVSGDFLQRYFYE